MLKMTFKVKARQLYLHRCKTERNTSRREDCPCCKTQRRLGHRLGAAVLGPDLLNVEDNLS